MFDRVTRLLNEYLLSEVWEMQPFLPDFHPPSPDSKRLYINAKLFLNFLSGDLQSRLNKTGRGGGAGTYNCQGAMSFPKQIIIILWNRMKGKIHKTGDVSKCWLCKAKNEMVASMVSACSKIAQRPTTNNITVELQLRCCHEPGPA